MVMSVRKAALIIIVLLLGIGAASCATDAGGKVNWLHDWYEASSKADMENKLIMIDFYTEWCPPCKQMDSDTFSDDELSAFLNDSFICLKSNAGESVLHASFGIEYVPTFVFTSPEGEEFERMVGYYPPDAFYQGTLAILNQWGG